MRNLLLPCITLVSFARAWSQNPGEPPLFFRLSFAKSTGDYELSGRAFSQEHDYGAKVITNRGTLIELKRFSKTGPNTINVSVVWRMLAFSASGECLIRAADVIVDTNRNEAFLALSSLVIFI